MHRICNLQRHLERFATTPRRSGQLPSASEVIRILFFTLGDQGGRDYEGDLADVKNFVTWFKSLVRLENRPDRLEAIETIERELLGSPFRSAFPHINLQKFIFQLVLTIREPRLINQAWTLLCAIVALIIQMAKKKPVQYAELAISLIKHGRAAIGRAEIEPYPYLQQSRPIGGLGECASVVLTSVRNSATVLDARPRGVGTMDGLEICSGLRHAGYLVENHLWDTDNTTHTWRYPRDVSPESILRTMVEKIAARQNVFMADTGITVALRFRRPIVAESLVPHLSYVSRCRLNSTHVLEFKAYGYGKSLIKQNIPLHEFLPYYCGFISFTDRP